MTGVLDAFRLTLPGRRTVTLVLILGTESDQERHRKNKNQRTYPRPSVRGFPSTYAATRMG